MTSAAAIAVEGLCKSYRTKAAVLDTVNLQVPAGTAFGLVGPNGAGKTTLIKCLLGIARPSSGSVNVLGGPPESVDVRRGLGYVPERLDLPETLTPRTFLASIARVKRLGAASAELDLMLSRVGLSSAAGDRIGAFSKGMRQRLAIAAALLGRPRLLILDEPTDGVDPIGRMDIRRLVREEVDRGCTVLLNSHLLSETERLCDRIAILLRGRIVQEGSIHELRRTIPGWSLRFRGSFVPEHLQMAGFVHAAAERTALEEDLWTFSGDDDVCLNDALARARAAGALLIDLRPHEMNLEQLFAVAVAKDGRS